MPGLTCSYCRLYLCLCFFVFEGCVHLSFQIDCSMGKAESWSFSCSLSWEEETDFLHNKQMVTLPEASTETYFCHTKLLWQVGRGRLNLESKPNTTYGCASWFLIPSEYLHSERTLWSTIKSQSQTQNKRPTAIP